jgi:hypothetical protein
VTWTKLGDEFSDEARDLTDAEHRTHIDALGWSNRRGLDLLIPKRDLRKFAESPDAEAAVTGLVAKDWWEDRGDCWYAGLRFPEWQLERAVVVQRKEANALRVRRSRMHKAGDHSICVVGNCPAAVTHDVTRDVMHYDMRDETHYPGRVGSGQVPPDPQVQNQDQPQDPSQDQVQKPDALRLPQIANSKTASSRFFDPPVVGQAPHFPGGDSESTGAGTGARGRARRPDNPAA